MEDFSDLFESGIPLEVATEFMGFLRKEAVSDSWLRQAALKATKGAPKNRLDEVSMSSMRGALGQVKAKNEDGIRKRLIVKATVDKQKVAARDGFDGMDRQRGVVDNTPEAAPAEVDAGDTTAQALTGPFAGSPEEVALALSQLISQEFKSHQWYSYYSEMVRGTDRGSLAELFEELAASELEDAHYLLRRLSALSPKGVIPVVPPPAAETDPAKIVKIMLAEEQRTIVMARHLYQLVGENPMRYQLEQLMADEQIHADRLTQFVKGSTKVAAAVSALKQQVAQQPIVTQEPSPDEVIEAEGQADLQQAQAENVQLQQQVQEYAGVAQEQAAAAEQANQLQQQLGDQLAQTQQQATESDMNAQDAMQQAYQGQQAAAQHADATMRVGIRLQQMRQQLADMAGQDPASEEGIDVDPIMTAGQQGQVDPATGMPIEGVEPGQPGMPEAGGNPGEAAPAAAEPKPKKEAKPKEPKKEAALPFSLGGGKWTKGQLLGAGIGMGIGAPSVIHSARAASEAKKQKVAAFLTPAQGISRVGQLLTGSHAKALRSTADAARAQATKSFASAGHSATRAAALKDSAGHAAGKAEFGALFGGSRSQAAHDALHADRAHSVADRASNLATSRRFNATGDGVTADRAAFAHLKETAKVRNARAGAVVVGGGLTGAGVAAGASKKKEASEEPHRKARIAAVADSANKGGLIGSGIGATLAHRKSLGAGLAATALGGVIGGGIGAQRGNYGFKREHTDRLSRQELTLEAGRRARADKLDEKSKESHFTKEHRDRMRRSEQTLATDHVAEDKVAGLRSYLHGVAHGIGSSAARGASKELGKGAKKVLGVHGAVTASGAAASAATAIHQGRKTREAIKEHAHGE